MKTEDWRFAALVFLQPAFFGAGTTAVACGREPIEMVRLLEVRGRALA